MVKITFVQQAGGATRTVVASAGRSVMQVATDHLVAGVDAECGGQMSCATCHVFVDEAWSDRWPARSADEEAMLEATSEEPTVHSRLACQLLITPEHDGAVIHIPRTQKY